MNKIFNTYSLSLTKFSFKNVILLILLVGVALSVQVWIVCKTLSLLNDVTKIIIVNHGRRVFRSWPDGTKYLLNWDKHLNTQDDVFECYTAPNCILTKDRSYLDNDYTLFDAVLFSEWFLESKIRPYKETNTVNIFTSTSPSNNKVCDEYYDDYFNLTFTYRLDSDIVWKQFVVRNFNGDIIAPSHSPIWNINSNCISQEIRTIIKRKSKAIAYIDSNDKFSTWKETYISELEEYFPKYSLKINVYNSSEECGNERCDVILRKEYYFYIIFEDYFAEDFVTKKILRAYDNYVVPILYGGANYSRFLPPHSYIDGRLSSPRDIAIAVNESLTNSTQYEEYFKWRNTYKIESYQPFCDLCETLNNQMNTVAKRNFRRWWNGEERFKLCSESPK